MRTFALFHTPLQRELDYYAFCECSEEGCGNYYDFIPRDFSRLVLSFGDLPSAIQVPSITIPCMQALVRGLTAGSGGDIAGVAHELNTTLYLLGPQQFCAPWFYALFDPVRREFRYVNAGHEPPLLVRKHSGEVHRLEHTGAALGLSMRGTHQHEVVSVEPGDVLAVCSEGLMDDLGEAGIAEVIVSNPAAGAAELTRRVFEQAGRVTLSADRTFAAVRVVGACERPIVEVGEELMVCAA